MREEVARTVHPVFRHGLLARERLKRGEKLRMADVQAELKGLLRAVPGAAERLSGRGHGEAFLGVRYALACWLDEVFILDSPWRDAWNEQKVETSLYGSNDRAWKFWEQARQAEVRSDADALEVLYLCVMLGFRGDLRDDPDRLHDWREGVEGQFRREQAHAWPEAPAELPLPPTDVPPLRGRERLRLLLLAFAVVAGFSIMAAAFSAARLL
jgi:type VI secretion system protein ImpK